MFLTKPIEYKRLAPKFHDDVMLHLKDTFFVDEPLNKAMQICERGEGHSDLEQLVLDTMNEGISVLALSEDGHVRLEHLHPVSDLSRVHFIGCWRCTQRLGV